MLHGTALSEELGRWLALVLLASLWLELRIRSGEQLMTELFLDDYPATGKRYHS